jgi:hypothetical protein
MLDHVSEDELREWAKKEGVSLPLWLPTELGEEISVRGTRAAA